MNSFLDSVLGAILATSSVKGLRGLTDIVVEVGDKIMSSLVEDALGLPRLYTDSTGELS